MPSGLLNSLRGLGDSSEDGEGLEEQPTFERGQQLWRRRLGQDIGGLAGMFLDRGSREQVAEQVSDLLSPVTSAMDWFGYSPYEEGQRTLRKGLQLSSAGPAPQQYYNWLSNRVMSGPFETEEGVLTPAAGGLTFPQRAEALRMGSAFDEIPMVRGTPSPQRAQQQLRRAAWLNRIAGTMQDIHGGDVRSNLKKLFESGITNKLPLHAIPGYLRRRQIERGLMS